jgi:hypothetical protein
MFRGIAGPFAQEPLEIAPNILDGSGSVTTADGGSSVDGRGPFQIGLGNVEVIFLVPQPTKNIALASKNMRLAATPFDGSIIEFSLLVEFIRFVSISVSSSMVSGLQKERNYSSNRRIK